MNYRISKYDPQYRVADRYQRSEWTSICDIGKKYDGKRFTEEEYLKVEASYVDFVLAVCRLQRIESLTVADLENHDHFSWHNGQKLSLALSEDFIRGCLREQFWGRLVSRELAFEAGYDYYMHIGCSLPRETVERLARERNLFAQEWRNTDGT